MNRRNAAASGPTPEETRLMCRRALLNLNIALAISRQHVRILADPNVITLPLRPRRRRTGH